MPLAEISAALSATSNAVKLLKGINETAKQVEINLIVLEMQAQLIDLSAKIIAIQAEYESLNKSKVDVENELIEERKKTEDRSKYELTAHGSGFVYRYAGKGGPPHNLCTTCFDSGEKSILQQIESTVGQLCMCKRDANHNFYP